MNRDLSNLRVSYKKDELLVKNMASNPIEQFSSWYAKAESDDAIKEPNAVTLSTLGVDGFAKSRIVLLKSFDQNGFVFYTNYKSEKGKSIEQHNQVGLSFFWPSLERQVIITGIAQKLEAAVSDTYFSSRPKDSQLGALVSDQSTVIPDRTYLEEHMNALKAKYADSAIARPDHWGGFLVQPYTVEFWQGRPNRLHDRIRYRIKEQEWIKERLAP